MYYPWLDVPILTAPAIIKTMALLFAFVAYYAVGGGILLVLENGRALRSEDTKYRSYLKKYARFFVLFTVPLGMTTGVGLLFALGLAAPLAAQTLVHHFAFVFVIEWCLWLLALVSLFAFYYCWDKLGPAASRLIGRVYATTAWCALVLLTSVVSFTLNSVGVVEDYESTGVLWHALVNVQSLPQAIARTGGSLFLGAVFFLVHASYSEKDLNLRERVAKRMRAPAFIGILLMLAGAAGSVFFLSETGRLTLERLASTGSCAWLFCVVLLAIFVLLIVGPCLKSREVNFAQTLALVFLTFVWIGIFDRTCGNVGRPYAVDRIVYANQLCRGDVQETRQIGLLYKGTWTTYALDVLQEKYPDLKISAANYLGVDSIHLEPPVIPEQSDDEEEAGDENEAPEDAEESDVDQENEALGIDVNVGFFAQTAAQRQLADQNGFVPVSSVPDANALQNRPTPSALNQTPSRQNPQAPLASQPYGGSQGATLQSPAQGQTARNPDSAARNRSFPQNVTPNSSPASQGNVPLANPTDGSVQTERNSTTANSTPTGTFSGVQTPTQVSQSQNVVDGSGPVNDRRRVARPQTTPAVMEEISAPPTPTIPPTTSDLDEAASDPEEPVGEEEDSLTRVLPEELDLDVNGPIARGNEDLLRVDYRDQIELGRTVFMHHCNSCHAAERGFSAVGPLVAGLSTKEIKYYVLRLNFSRFDMPPWAGTDVEAELLAEYLDSIASKTPNDAFMKDKPKKEPKPKPEKSKKSKKQKSSEKSEEEGAEEIDEAVEGSSDEEISALPETDDLLF